ncbi:hypothetical protein C0584_01840 [Candidatus Parcubacteria bacterium]|nr:MAG: hypothetical protein C0584_01840 [Candidatus Parcubacteria bacterium]
MFFNKSFVKIVVLSLLLTSFFVMKPNMAANNEYVIRTAVSEGWEAGQDEYWHLQPVNEKNNYSFREKIHFFVQSDYINIPHTWTIRVYTGDSLVKEMSANYDPGNYGWQYSNFTPWINNLDPGNYRVEYYLNSGAGEELANSLEFSVSDNLLNGLEPYKFSKAETATTWAHGDKEEHWNLQAVGKKNRFSVGENVQLIAQVKDIYVDHRYRVELREGGITQWDYESEWMQVGDKWDYGNFFPSYQVNKAGSYEFRVFIDTGEGYKHLANVPFTVEGEIPKYSYSHTDLATGFEYGAGEEYWNMRAVNQKNVFQKGDTIYAMSQVRNIKHNHQWKVELYKGADLMWEYEDEWRGVGNGWIYGNFYPAFHDAQPGEYTFKIYLNIGDGYELLESKAFSVEGTVEKPKFDHAILASGWMHGVDAEHWNLVPVGNKSVFTEGEDVHLVAQVRNIQVDHRYRVELHQGEETMWGYDTEWLDVGPGWKYSNFFPVYTNAEVGSYEFWYYLDTGEGFEYFGKKAFEVVPQTPDPETPPVVDPPVVEEPPVVDPPVVEEPPVVDPPVVEEPPVVEPPVVEPPVVTYKDYNRGVTAYNTIDKNDFAYFRDNGISTVRLMLMDGDLLPPSAEFDVDSSSRSISPENVTELKNMISLAKEYEIKLVVDVHEVPGLNRWFLSETKPKDTRLWEETSEGEKYRDVLVTLWDQLSEVMKNEDVELVSYELLNEPEPKTDIDPNENKAYLWTDTQDRIINAIRANGDSHLIIASPAYAWRTESLSEWVPSDVVMNDENIIASVHGYRPIQFTIQEEAWYGNTEYNTYPSLLNEEHYGETEWNYTMIDSVFTDVVDTFYDTYNMPVYIAEFAVNREAPGAEQWLLDMMNIMNKNHSEEVWGWSVHVWEEDQYARLNHLDYDWSRAGMNDFSADPAQLEAVLAGINNTEETLMQ